MTERRANARPVARNTAQSATRPATRRAAPQGRGGVHHAAPERRYAILKWVLLAALAVYTVLVVGANSARDVDFSVIRSAIAAAPGVAELKTLDENGFQERMDATPAGCEDWLMVGSDEIMDVSELLIAKADEATLDGLESAVQKRLEAQLAVFRSYGVNQKDLLEGATLLRRGNYLFYAVGEHADQWEDAFLACIR